MRQVVKRPLAKKDFKQIWLYTFQTWGERQANLYLGELDQAIQALAADPERGKFRDHIRPGYRSIHVNRHIVYYTFTATLVRIVRVLHERMDPDRHF